MLDIMCTFSLHIYLLFRINPDMEPDLIADVLCNPIAVNKQGQVLQEIVNLQMSLKSRSRSSLKADNSLIERSRLKVKTDFSPDGKYFLYKSLTLNKLYNFTRYGVDV